MVAHRHILAPLPDDCFKALLDQTFDEVSYVDAKRRILYWNKGAETITGYAAQDMVGQKCDRDEGLCHIGEDGTRLCDKLCPLLAAIEDGKNSQKRVHLRNKDGRRIPVDAVSSPVYNGQGNLQGAVQIFRDASIYEEEAKASELLSRLAALDPLTELLNRRKIEMELDLELKKSKRLGLPLSLIFCDLDYFKHVNDEYGHQVGDEVLKGVSKQLQAGIREYDRAVRYGGEEFLIMLPQTKAEIAVEIAERLRQSVERWKLIHQEKLWPFNITISLGVAELARDESPESLIDRADKALYRAKKSGRNAVFVT
ncbi:sensor domain-containing diguanylate cyclase [candidate division TA06 bacterium]|uniref:Sensor domain-containing diguanylate cyclase n=1 Tax=candidate division TA06 bacterium TaxID=2250710 RepID=A0A933I6R4_UNCT6|nr:sensor domain-containing diguanylate cyclase [candidate division TA06 bacterium]